MINIPCALVCVYYYPLHTSGLDQEVSPFSSFFFFFFLYVIYPRMVTQ